MYTFKCEHTRVRIYLRACGIPPTLPPSVPHPIHPRGGFQSQFASRITQIPRMPYGSARCGPLAPCTLHGSLAGDTHMKEWNRRLETVRPNRRAILRHGANPGGHDGSRADILGSARCYPIQTCLTWIRGLRVQVKRVYSASPVRRLGSSGEPAPCARHLQRVTRHARAKKAIKRSSSAYAMMMPISIQ